MLRIKYGAVALLLTTGIVFAHAGATGIVKQRMDAMKNIAASMKLLNSEIGSRSMDLRAVNEAISVIQSNSGEALIALYPNGSTQHPTEASENIWKNPTAFSDAAFNLSRKADLLRMTVNNPAIAGDKNAVIAERFEALKTTCKSCHKDFRVDK